MSLDFSQKPLVVGVVSDAATWRSLAQDTPCDLVELRVDALPEEERLLPLSHPCPKPLLITARHASEGGNCVWDEAERTRLVSQLLPTAAALDWEVAQLAAATELIAEAKARGVTVIASAHDFAGTPTTEDMLATEQQALAVGADVVKMAFTPLRAEDLMVGVEFLRRPHATPIAIMGMGGFAAASRALYAHLGSALLYGYLGDQPTAPGQWPASLCRALCS